MDKDGNTYVPVAVVDGQQRLTTIVLLLDGICRSLAGFSDSARGLSQGIKKNFIAAQEINGQPLFKLSLLAKNIQEKESPEIRPRSRKHHADETQLTLPEPAIP